MPFSNPTDLDPLLVEVEWARKHGLFERQPYEALLQAYSLDVADELIEELLVEGIRELKVQEIRGELEPFREPELDVGDVVLGMSRSGKEVRIPLQTLTAGTLIAMRTGGGKSNLLRFLAPQIAFNQVNVWITDQWKRETRHVRPFFIEAGSDLVVLTPETMKYDPLHPGSCDPRHHLPNVTSVLAQRLGLGERSQVILYQIGFALYDEFGIWEGQTDAYPCLFDLWTRVRTASGVNAPARDAILDRLAPVLVEMKPWRLGWNPQDLTDHNICFEMSGALEAVKHVLLEPLLYNVFQTHIESGLVNAPLGLFITIEDAQAYTQEDPGGGMTPLDIGAGLFRSTGLGLCASVQTLEGLSRKLTPNLSGLKVMGPMGSHHDYVQLGADMGLDRDQIEWAKQNLAPGTYVASADRWPEPFVMRVPHVPLRREVSDEEARESVAALDHLKTKPAEEYLDWKPSYVAHVRTGSGEAEDPGSQKAKTGDLDWDISKEHLDYLESVASSPFLNATQRDSELGFSGWKGNKLRKQLARMGLVRSVTIRPGGRGKNFLLLELTKKGRELLDAFGIPVPAGQGRGGIEHRWWVSKLAEWFRARDMACEIEHERHGARVDLSVEADHGLVAVEVEVSPGHELQNIRKDLEVGFAEVVCLAKELDQVESVRTQVVRQLKPGEVSQVHVGHLQEYRVVLSSLVCFGSG